MRKFILSIIVVFSALYSNAQQLTFADILNAEPEVKISQNKPQKSKPVKHTTYKSYSYSPLQSLDRTFFESYFSVLGNVGSLSYSSYDSYGYSRDARRITYGLGLEYEFGARFAPLFFIGVGIGARTYFPDDKNNYGNLSSWGFNMPLYGAAKIYMWSDYDFSMSTDFGLGGCFTLQKSNTTPSGMFLKIGLGADVRRFTISAGYEMIANISGGSMGHYGYLKLGVIISK